MKAIAKWIPAVMTALLISAHAASIQDQIIQTARSTDDLVAQKDLRAVSIDKHGKPEGFLVQPATPRDFAPRLALTLGLPQEKVEGLLKKKESISGIAFAQMIATKSGQGFESIYKSQGTDRWIAQLKDAKISLADANRVLDNLYTEAAIISLDAQMKPLAQSPSQAARPVQSGF